LKRAKGFRGLRDIHITLINSDDEVWASGIRSISAMLRGAGHLTTMIFAGASEASISESVIQGIAELVGDSEIIGISSMSRGSVRAKTLIEGLRPLGRLVVWGGMHPTLFPEDCSRYADLVCRGEGEEFMLDLAERVVSGRGFEDIPNGAYLSNGRTILNDLRPLIADLDSLSFLDFAFENEYILDPAGMLVQNGKMREKGVVLFSGSRGCFNSCTYCSNSQLKSIYKGQERYARKMSIPRFVEAAMEYRRLFPRAGSFYFTDEDFFARPVEEMRDFAETYSSQVGVPFECMASPSNITEEKVALAVKAGMFLIDVGLESGSERIRREVFNRHVSDETQLQAAIAINKHARGSALYFLILGNPYEERQDLLKGVRFLEMLPPPFSLRAYNLVFIPGTKLFERACQEGIIEGIDDSGSEMDFLAGFDYKTHDWKRKNIYLNGLVSLMHGKSTKWRIGFVPRMIISVLSAPRVVDLCDRHTRIGETICDLARLRLRMCWAIAISLGEVYKRISLLRRSSFTQIIPKQALK
jgi:anaerobic magnesium-protoporphyrin IX monomethyl ester cyclase